jgi:hypothetical protein
VQHRREKINERLKTLQHLIPNGAKVSFRVNQLPGLVLSHSQECQVVGACDEYHHLIFSVCFWLMQVDIVTMLDEAVHYVQFLQLQVKVIWPFPGSHLRLLLVGNVTEVGAENVTET